MAYFFASPIVAHNACIRDSSKTQKSGAESLSLSDSCVIVTMIVYIGGLRSIGDINNPSGTA